MGILLESPEMQNMMSEFEGIMNAMSAMSIISDLISLAIVIFMCVVMWKINEKAGQPGWACLIPFYSSYIDCKVAKKKWLFVPQLINSIVMVIATFTMVIGVFLAFAMAIEGSGGGAGLLIGSMVILFITSIISIVFNVIYSDGLAKAFGQGVGYTIGLIFLPNIFKAIIAFSNNIKYIDDDGVILNGGYTNYNENPQPSDPESRLNQNSADWNTSNFN